MTCLCVLIMLVTVASSLVVKFPLEKIENRQFVAGILARAAKGLK